MAMKTRFAVCVIVVATLIICGCGGGNPGPRPASSPKDLINRLCEALYEANKAELVSCFSGNDAELKAIGSLADLGGAALSFKRAFIKEYGPKRRKTEMPRW